MHVWRRGGPSPVWRGHHARGEYDSDPLSSLERVKEPLLRAMKPLYALRSRNYSRPVSFAAQHAAAALEAKTPDADAQACRCFRQDGVGLKKRGHDGRCWPWQPRQWLLRGLGIRRSHFLKASLFSALFPFPGGPASRPCSSGCKQLQLPLPLRHVALVHRARTYCAVVSQVEGE